MTRRLLARLIPVLGITLLAACSNLTGPQSSTLSSSAVTGQDQQQTTQQGPRQGTGKNAGVKPGTGIQ